MCRIANVLEQSALAHLQSLQPLMGGGGHSEEGFYIYSNDGTPFYFHNFLRRRCEVFGHMLDSSLREGQEQGIHLQSDCATVEALRGLQDFFYGNSTTANTHSLPVLKNLIVLGDMYGMRDLTEFSTAALLQQHVSLENVLELMRFCDLHGVTDEDLLAPIHGYICSHFTVEQLSDMGAWFPALMRYFITVWLQGGEGLAQQEAWDASGVIWRPAYRHILTPNCPFVTELQLKPEKDWLLTGVAVNLDVGARLQQIRVTIFRGKEAKEFAGMAVENDVRVVAESGVHLVRFSTAVRLVAGLPHSVLVRMTGEGTSVQHAVPRAGKHRHTLIEMGARYSQAEGGCAPPPPSPASPLSTGEDDEERYGGGGGSTRTRMHVQKSTPAFTAIAYLKLIPPTEPQYSYSVHEHGKPVFFEAPFSGVASLAELSL